MRTQVSMCGEGGGVGVHEALTPAPECRVNEGDDSFKAVPVAAAGERMQGVPRIATPNLLKARIPNAPP